MVLVDKMIATKDSSDKNEPIFYNQKISAMTSIFIKMKIMSSWVHI